MCNILLSGPEKKKRILVPFMKVSKKILYLLYARPNLKYSTKY